ncbi:MAG: hypothetical protein JWP63_5680 [Candidatus Solibacter sp.]|nr:hypothetical protein [Candidatus Solibacter sp.]
MIFCHSCEIALPDGTSRCPMCQRNLRFPAKLVIGGAALTVFALVSLFLWITPRVKNRIDRSQFSSEEVLQAAQSLVKGNPAVRNPVGFSTMDQTTVEHWDGRRWRVSGYIDSRPQPGVKVRTLYFAVVLNNGRDWDLEDLQLQSMEFGGSSIRKN